MFNRHLLIVLLLAGSVAIPYLAQSEQGKKLWSGSGGSSGSSAGRAAEPLASAPLATMPPPATVEGLRHNSYEGFAGPPPETQVEGSTPVTLEQVLRFDITPTWITQQWPRVSTGLAELDLQGYRVALVTGTRDSDLAGSLTYYFNKKKQVERITFHGLSGDPRRLVSVVTGQYELKPQKSDDPALTLFARKRWGRAESELRIRPAAVLRSELPQARYEIELALRRP